MLTTTACNGGIRSVSNGNTIAGVCATNMELDVRHRPLPSTPVLVRARLVSVGISGEYKVIRGRRVGSSRAYYMG